MTEQNFIGAIEEQPEIKEGVSATTQKPWKRATFKLGGKTFSTFDIGIINSILDGTLKVGTLVDLTYKTDGKYNNIVVMFPATSEQRANFTPASEFKPEPKVDDKVWIEKDKRIVRQNCNERAIEFVELLSKVNPEKLKEIMEANGNNLLSVIDVAAEHFETRVWR